MSIGMILLMVLVLTLVGVIPAWQRELGLWPRRRSRRGVADHCEPGAEGRNIAC